MTKRYDAAIDLSADTSHTRILRRVPPKASVLEFGCATGYMSRVLAAERGCRVTGIELDPEAAAAARGFAERVIVGDAETLDYASALGDARFDVLIFADVLEHLRDPGAVLRAIRPFLAPGGKVLASLPNVAHGALALELLQGRFTYRERGLLDDSHLRFFTRQTMSDLFEGAGYVIEAVERLRAEPAATEFQTRVAELPPEVVRFALAHDEATTYQFVVEARPAGEPATLAELVRLRAELDHALAALAARQAELIAVTAQAAELDRARQVIAAQAAELDRVRPFLAATPTAWVKLGARLALPARHYAAARRAYRRLRGARPPGP